MDNLPRKTFGKPRKDTPDKTFNNSYQDIYSRFSEGVSCIKIAEEFNVTRQAAHRWKRAWMAWLEFSDEPAAITTLKKHVEKEVRYNNASTVLKEASLKKSISRKTMEIDKLRLRGLDLSNKILDRMEVLIGKEKSVGGLAKALSAILPYVATKQDGDSDKGLTPDEKRMAFVKNVMNVYNININDKKEDDEPTEDDYDDWNPAE